MKKKLLALFLMAAMLLGAAGCSGTANPSDQTKNDSDTVQNSSDSAQNDKGETLPDTSQAQTHLIVDHADHEVEVPYEVNRIVVSNILPLPSVISVFFDSADKIVGMAGGSMTAAANGLLGELYPEILTAETGFIDGSALNIEEVMKLNPDVVFYSASQPEQGEQLRQAGLAAVAVSVNKWNYNAMETLTHWIELLSEIFPDNDKTEIVEKHSREMYDLVQQRVAGLSDEERQRVFFLFQYTETNMLTSGRQFFGQWWADAIGAVNVAQELTTDNSVAVDLEQVYAWNPSLIFVTNFTTAKPTDLYENTVGQYDWSPVDAVKHENVYKMPLGMYRSYTPGVDTPVTLLWMAKTAYPALFEDIDILATTKDYYQDVFGIALTDEQAASIFNPSVDANKGFGG